MAEELSRQAILDEEHIKLLSLGYMISAGISAFFGLFGLFYVGMGAFVGEMISHLPPEATSANGPAPAFIGWIFAGFGLLFCVLMTGIAALKLRAAFCLKQRRSRTFIMVVAALCCLDIPYGTLLGTFSFIVLGRASVEAQFKEAQFKEAHLPAATA
jgi:hypothetical protein